MKKIFLLVVGIFAGTVNITASPDGNAPAVLFTESRANPVEPAKGLPATWKAQPKNSPASFSGDARPGEFFVFQIGVNAREKTGALDVRFSALKNNSGGDIPAAALRCISLGGTGDDGKIFKKKLTLAPGDLQILWIGVDVPATAQGRYEGIVTVDFGNGKFLPVSLSLNVAGTPVEEFGCGEAKNLSRLRWLDSAVGSEDTLTAPFVPVSLKNKNTIAVLGRDLTLGADGLPAQITSYFSPANTGILPDAGRPVLAAPMRFVAETAAGAIAWKTGTATIETSDTGARWTTQLAGDNGLSADVSGRLDYTGSGEINVRLTAARDIALEDARLEIPYAGDAARYFMGLNRTGGKFPGNVDWHWDVKKRQDCFWLGDVNAGMMLRFKDEKFVRPLVNIYYEFRPLVEPASWGNAGKGGIRVAEKDGAVLANAYSGARTLRAGETLNFIFEIYLTPFRPLDIEQQFKTRFVQPHPNKSPAPLDKALADADALRGPNIINIHQAAFYSPYINYPYSDESFPAFCDYVKRAHEKNVGVRVYYTTREITNNMPEFVALHTLAGEVIHPGPGPAARTILNSKGPNPILTQTLGTGFIPAWVDKVGGKYADWDLSVITTPDSRWNNFYLEGLRRLCEKSDFDGPYIDDTALDARSMQRARRILDTRPGRLVDLHTWNHFNGLAGYANNLSIYMEILPYVDRLWLGESFDCNAAAWDFWLVEMSGLPFGLMSEMLQAPNPWRGLVFGETGRLGWSGDPRGIWKVWDEYGIAGTRFRPFFEKDCPVKPDNDAVKITVYQKPGRAFIALGSWTAKDVPVKLAVDWRQLGLDPAKARLYAPEISGMQPEKSFSPDEAIPVQAGRGWFFILDETPREVAAAEKKLPALVPVFNDPFTQPVLEKGWLPHAAAGATAQISANAFRIEAPANKHAGIERALPPGVIAAEVELDAGTDVGQDWGPGVALVWANGAAAQINLRLEDMKIGVVAGDRFRITDARFKRDAAQTLGIILTKDEIIFRRKTGEESAVIAKLPRDKALSGAPATLRIGKMKKGGAWEDHPIEGKTGTCAVRAVTVFGE